jgi:Acetoacetate decarboxylase (ADC)
MTGSLVSPAYTGGVLNVMGTRPENAFKYDAPAMRQGTWFSLTFTSTHDAIEKVVVPPGLTVDRDLPPEVDVQYFVNPETRAYDGRITSYQGFMFMAHVRHGDVTGRAGWEFVDGLHGDKTHVDILSQWGVYFGMLKKLADIRFTPIGGNEFEVTVARRGVRLATLTIRTGAELASSDVELINAASSQWPRTLTVREIPNVNYSGFVERAVCIAGTESANTVTQAWAADRGSISFGHDELDPLDELPVLGVSNEIVYKLDVAKELFSEMTVLENLPLEVGEPAIANLA